MAWRYATLSLSANPRVSGSVGISPGRGQGGLAVPGFCGVETLRC